MNVLSLFDGVSSAQVALQRAEIPVTNYYASEVDVKQIAIAQKNFPNTIQLGNIRTVKAEDLPKIDLLIAHLPSSHYNSIKSGVYNIRDITLDALFLHFKRLLKELQPKYFILGVSGIVTELVDSISHELDGPPVRLDTANYSACSRLFKYWTNFKLDIQMLEQQIETNFKDIMEIDGNYPVLFNVENHLFDSDSQLILPKLEKFFTYTTPKLIGERNGKSIYDIRGKTPLYDSSVKDGPLFLTNPEDKIARRMTILEAERIQTLPDRYTEGEYNRNPISTTDRMVFINQSFNVTQLSFVLKSLTFLPE